MLLDFYGDSTVRVGDSEPSVLAVQIREKENL